MNIVTGLTGQTGSGKTTVCRIFADEGFEIIDCDKAAREVTSPGSNCCKKLAEIFPQCFDEDYTLDRKSLGNIVFADKNKLDMLNNTIFPYICKLLEEKISESKSRYILLDAPTLFEAGADKLCNVIVCVTAEKNIRKARIMQRDNLTEIQAEDRISSQKSEEFFEKHSDYCIKNNLDKENAYFQTKKVINSIKERFNGNN